MYDTLNKTWQEVPNSCISIHLGHCNHLSQISPMHSKRCYVSVVELKGVIYAMGGFNGEIRLNTVERYDPMTNQWTLIESMNHVRWDYMKADLTDFSLKFCCRSDAHACVLNNKIYITGSLIRDLVCLMGNL